MLPASKHFNLIIGIDVHLVNIPPAVGVPMPHPFVGIMFDPVDYLPYLGSMVHVNKAKRSNSGTTGTLGIKKHIPMGAAFFPATMPMIAHEAQHFFGSLTVKADGSYFSGATFILMTCSCIGLPLGGSEKYLPTATSIPIPTGQPVIVGGPQVPDLLGALQGLAMAKSLKFLAKKAGKIFKKVKKKLKGCGCS